MKPKDTEKWQKACGSYLTKLKKKKVIIIITIIIAIMIVIIIIKPKCKQRVGGHDSKTVVTFLIRQSSFDFANE